MLQRLQCEYIIFVKAKGNQHSCNELVHLLEFRHKNTSTIKCDISIDNGECKITYKVPSWEVTMCYFACQG